MDKAESIMNKVSKVRDMAEKGINTWNTAAKIHNSFVDEDEKWPVVDGAGKKPDRSEIKRAIESGDPEKIAKYKDKLTVSETLPEVRIQESGTYQYGRYCYEHNKQNPE